MRIVHRAICLLQELRLSGCTELGPEHWKKLLGPFHWRRTKSPEARKHGSISVRTIWAKAGVQDFLEVMVTGLAWEAGALEPLSAWKNFRDY